MSYHDTHIIMLKLLNQKRKGSLCDTLRTWNKLILLLWNPIIIHSIHAEYVVNQVCFLTTTSLFNSPIITRSSFWQLHVCYTIFVSNKVGSLGDKFFWHTNFPYFCDLRPFTTDLWTWDAASRFPLSRPQPPCQISWWLHWFPLLWEPV